MGSSIDLYSPYFRLRRSRATASERAMVRAKRRVEAAKSSKKDSLHIIINQIKMIKYHQIRLPTYVPRRNGRLFSSFCVKETGQKPKKDLITMSKLNKSKIQFK